VSRQTWHKIRPAVPVIGNMAARITIRQVDSMKDCAYTIYALDLLMILSLLIKNVRNICHTLDRLADLIYGCHLR